MADGNYESESSVDRRISVTVQAMARTLRAEIEPIKKQAAASEIEIARLNDEIAKLKQQLALK